MKSVKKIEKLIRKINVTPASGDNKLNEILLAQENSKKTPAAASRPDIWNLIMKNQMTKFATATVIIILAVISIWYARGTENSPGPKAKQDNNIVKKPEDKLIAKSPETLDSQDSDNLEDNKSNKKILAMAGTRNRRATMGVKRIDIERRKAEAKKIKEMAAVGDIDGLTAMLSTAMFRNKISAAEYLGEIGDERALPILRKIEKRYICGLRKDGSVKFRTDAYGYRPNASSGAFAVAICKIKTRDLSAKEQIDALFELLDDCIVPKMAPDKPFLMLGSHGLSDIPINEYGFGSFDLGKRVAAELVKYDDPSIVTRLSKTKNKGAAITAVWLEIKDMTFDAAIDRCVEIAINEHEAKQYGAIKCLGKFGKDAVLALDELATLGHYEAMRMLGYLKNNPEVFKIICWHMINNETYLVRLLGSSQFSHSNIQKYQQSILLDTLVDALFDSQKSIRRRAASLLRTIANGKKWSQLLKYEDDLLLALEHPDKEVRAFITQTLKILDAKRLKEKVPAPSETRTDLDKQDDSTSIKTL